MTTRSITSRIGRCTSGSRRPTWLREAAWPWSTNRGGHPDAPRGDRPEMQITQDQVTRWMEAAGFELEREIELFEEKFFVIYRRVD